MIDGENTPLALLHIDAEHGWPALLDLAKPFLEQKGLDRLQACLDGTVRAVLVESHYIDKDYRDTFSNYHSKRFRTPDSRCIRLHFLDAPLSMEEVRNDQKVEAAYCGYSVIRPTRPNSIGRSLINPRKVSYAKGCLRLCEESVTIQGTLIRTEGFPFISQDADVTVCAQSALWMLLRFFSNRYPIYREIYPHQITQLTRDFSLGRVMPSSGLTDWQMAEALRQLGFSALIYSRKGYSPDEDPNLFDHLLYTYIESGIPVLASTGNHVVVAYGHASDYQKPIAENAPTLRSSYFNHAFVVSDDNFFPYQRIRDVPVNVPGCSSIKLSEIEAFTAPLPEKVFLAAEQFEALAKKLLLEHEKFGIEACSPTLQTKPLVTRVFLTSGRSFKRRAAARGMGHELVQKLYRNLPLPHFVWICEFSTSDLYREHQVLGELIWDATRNVAEQSGWLALHYPEKIFLDTGSAFNSLPEVIDFTLSMSNSYPLMVHNLEQL